MTRTVKMIVTDLDDTLLRDDKSVSAHSLEVLRRCREAGIKVAIATARGHPEKVVDTERFDGRILCNGAVIIAGGETHRQTIPCQEARPLLLACCRRGLHVSSQFGDTHYAASDLSALWPDIGKWGLTDFPATRRMRKKSMSSL